MEPPQTPSRRPGAEQLQQSPITPRNQQRLIQGMQNLSVVVASTPDPGEQRAMVANIAQYAVILADDHDVAVSGNVATEDRDEVPLTTFQDAGRGARMTQADIDNFIFNDEEADPELHERPDQPVVTEPHHVELAKMTLGVTPEFDIPTVTALRDEFCQAVSKLRMTIMKNKKMYKNQRFKAEEVAEITNLFFSELMGSKGLNRVASIVRQYQIKEEGEGHRGAGQKAHILADDTSIPQAVRWYFGAFSEVESKKLSQQSALFAFYQMQANLTLLQRFNLLREEVASPDSEVRDFLRAQGFQTARSIRWVSVVVQYIMHSLEISKNEVWNTSQAALSLQELAREFGNGILPLIPSTSVRRLNLLGNRKMVYVYALLKQHVAGIQEVFDAVETHVYEPLLQGRPIIMKGLRGGPSQSESMLERINSAVAAGQAEDQDGKGQQGQQAGDMMEFGA